MGKRPWIWLVAVVLLLGAGGAAVWFLYFRVPPSENPPPPRESAVQAVVRWGGRITRDESKEGQPVVGLDLSGTKIDDAGLKELRELTRLQTLNLASTPVTEAGIKELAGFKQLRTLTVPLGDKTLHALREAGLLHALAQARGRDGQRPASAADVVALDLSGTEVTEAGLKELAALKNLRTLTLPGSLPTDAALQTLREANLLHALSRARTRDGQRPASAAEVVSLDLSGTKTTDAGLKELAALPNLEQLTLSGTGAAGAGLKELKGLKNLKGLVLADADVNDGALLGLREAGLVHLLAQARAANGRRPASAAEVVALDLSGTKATDASLKELKGLDSLQTLKLAGRQATEAGLKELRDLKNLNELALDAPELTDPVFAALAAPEVGLLYLLTQAEARGGKRPRGPSDVLSLDLSGTALTEAGLEKVRDFNNLQTLTLPASRVTDGVLRTLRGAELLHSLAQAEAREGRRPVVAAEVVTLDLSGTKTTDAGLKELKGLVNLERLALAGTGVTGAGLADLKGFQNLKELRFATGDLTDGLVQALRAAGLLHLLGQARTADGQRPANASEVRVLDLSGAPTTDAGLKELRDLHNLQTLVLARTRVAGGGLRELKDLNHLRTLNLAGTDVSDRDLRGLAELPGLRSLDLSGTWVSDVGLPALRGLKELRELSLADTATTAAGRQKLAGALPGCRIQ